MAKYLAPIPPAIVFDPSCGKGDLLTAVADEFGTRGIDYVGIDRDPRAVQRCQVTLQNRGAEVTVTCGDFFEFETSRYMSHGKPVYVTMNPPFKGYGSLSSRKRRAIQAALPTLRGRYNLAHAFLDKTVAELRPKALVALLPGSWPTASYNSLRHLVRLPGNSWRPLPESIFREATTSIGILVLGSLGDHQGFLPKAARMPEDSRAELRQGVATGADAAYMRIAGLCPGTGRVVRCARGRDVAGRRAINSLPTMWVPPRNATSQLASFVDRLPKAELLELRARFSVQRKHHPVWDFHEAYPPWFLGRPKLIVPEICTRVSVLFDERGCVLPLHSTIAIRVDGRKAAKEVMAELTSDNAWRMLRSRCPRMVNGAIRLTVPALRALLSRDAPSTF